MSIGNEILGANGCGRIGKLTVWHHVARKYFNEIMVNYVRRNGQTSRNQVVRLENYKITELKIEFGIKTILKVGLKRQPSVKTVYKE